MLFIDSNTFYSNAYLKNVKGIHLNGKWTTFSWTECFAFVEKDYENILITFTVENGRILWNSFCFVLFFTYFYLKYKVSANGGGNGEVQLYSRGKILSNFPFYL